MRPANGPRRTLTSVTLIQPLVQDIALFAFLVLASQESDWTEIWFLESFHLGVHMYSFRSIDPAVTKLALPTDDDDRKHVMVRAHTWAKNDIHCTSSVVKGLIFMHQGQDKTLVQGVAFSSKMTVLWGSSDPFNSFKRRVDMTLILPTSSNASKEKPIGTL
jgi:hypothetical protein